jgi:hypothetical protein
MLDCLPIRISNTVHTNHNVIKKAQYKLCWIDIVSSLQGTFQSVPRLYPHDRVPPLHGIIGQTQNVPHYHKLVDDLNRELDLFV